jgi:CelD/BcsL family acetyltransferase involved in cellulose biosynthesis
VVLGETTELRLRSLRTAEEIEGIAPGWDALVASARRPSPFQLNTWVAAWMREFGEQFDPCITVAARAERIVGIAPFVVRRGGRVRPAHFVGGHESSLADVLLAPGEPIETAQKLLEPLAESGASALNAYGVPGDSVLARAAGDRLRVIPRVGSPVLEMPEGWPAAYERRMSKDRRSKDRRHERRLNELGSLEIAVAVDGPALGEALDTAFEIHRARWEGRPDGSSFGRPERQPFMRDTLMRLGDQGRYGMCLLRVDGRGVAFASWFRIGTTFYGHRTAFDPEFARCGPAKIAQRYAIAASSESGATRVEYLGDAEDYKRQMADRLDPMHQCVGLANGLAGQMYVAKVVGAIAARKRLKKIDRLHRLYRSGAVRVRGERAA